MKTVSDILFFVALGLIVISVISNVSAGPKPITGYDGVPIDNKSDVIGQQDNALRRLFKSWLLRIGLIVFAISILTSYL
ncbi:hypothetical protein E0485_20285 [Paenibacillus albiflavus]|uniref:Uncharacterized protein n=1 Tax=Paenibacillus albiflavus TaxID=2545760 RepID=A0A4R4E8A9_9BACL|nr:hypothetical protein [Paenibacillus albiflavus]TCZ74018.1 hypothetical protein E0485_20285 [Paenibacillus albiflavus]